MPGRGKRPRGDFDPNKSDSEDETWGDAASKPTRSRHSKSHTNKPARKKQRRKHNDSEDDDDEISESDLSAEVSEEGNEKEEEEIELGPNGRPRRNATKKAAPIIEDDDSEGSPEEEIEDEDKVAPEKNQPRRSLLIKLKVPQGRFPISTRRNTRAGSGSTAPSRPTSSHMPLSIGIARRSSRIAHDDTEIVALTNSGHHVETAGGLKSPLDPPARPTRGRKGIKRPGKTVVEEEEDGSAKSKEQQSTDELQKDYPPEIAASHDDLADEEGIIDDGDEKAQARSMAADDDREGGEAVAQLEDAAAEGTVIPESGEDEVHEDDDSDPISKPQRKLRQRGGKTIVTTSREAPSRTGGRSKRPSRSTLGKRKTRSSQRGANQESSDFEPMGDEGEEEDVSDSEASASPHKNSQEDDDSSPGQRGAKRRKVASRSRRASDDSEELAEELEELQGSRPRRTKKLDIIMEDRYKTRRQQNKTVNYDIMASNAALAQAIEEEEGNAPSQNTPSKRARGGGGAWARSLFSTYGPFGGAGGPPPVLGGPGGVGAVAGADSDSSDDENMQRPKPTGVGGTVGMTPTAAHPAGFGLFPPPAGQVHSADAAQATAGTPANLGRVRDKQALADADPLGVDQNVTFDGVGGLQGHIDQLKEMVALPLLYPEVFQRFHVTPPRGVLFHGPPGTGKTLLARALASSVSSQGKKVTFYMRKGADALSKWVGEAERQLRLLFEEARKNQPSIIFFDEIDGLAPVRSSKQEQIHASIVSTLLALMDGMDGRGQVIVIGATNRPDSVDPALRRPGRFDREFYFPLPNTEARRTILDIHTKNWSPPLDTTFKDEIARLTKGYGGADLRALCTEAALNAVQRRYPQIYKSNEKLQIDPTTINVTAKDFMISVKKMIPSSERSGSSGAAPLPTQIEPLLREPLKDIENLVSQALPQKKVLTALQEAEFQDAEDDRGIKAERMQQEFERSRVFRPRLLVKGVPGMGQQYLSGALLNHFEGLHVQAFDLPTLLSDSTRSSEAAIVQLFTEVRRHKPAVIYIPNVDTWYRTVGQAVISTFVGLLRTLAPTDPVLLFGTLECEEDDIDQQMLKDLFGFSRKCIFKISSPSQASRREYFNAVLEYLQASPLEFPEPTNRQKRILETLVPVPPEPPKEPTPPTKAELKAQKRNDRLALNTLKIAIQPVMDQIKTKYRKFRLAVIEEKEIRYLYEEADPNIVTSDLPEDLRQQYRPFEKSADEHGEPGLRHTETGKFFYNLDVATIEKRLSNGYYKRSRDFTADVKKLAKDAKAIGDEERLLKANELLANVEVDMSILDARDPGLTAELENVYAREVKRQNEMVEKAKQHAAEEGRTLEVIASNVPPDHVGASSTEQSSGPITLGQPLPNGLVQHPITPSNPSHPSTITNGLATRLSDLSDLQGHMNSNGTSVPSRGDGDVQMVNSDPSSREREAQGASFGPSAQTRPLESYTGGPTSLQQRKSIPNSLTQGSAVTPMAPGSQIADYTNYASTTSSDKRHTGSSGDKNTQSTPGVPDFSVLPEGMEPNSQLVDTVGNTQTSQYSARPHSNHSKTPSSQGQQPFSQSDRLSQTPAVPPFPRETSKTNINSLLTDGPPLPRASPSRNNSVTNATHPPLIFDEYCSAQLIDMMVSRTSGYSVEQLEQVYSALMSEIWATRGEWDRGKVARGVWKAFDEIREDIEYMQSIAQGSMDVE